MQREFGFADHGLNAGRVGTILIGHENMHLPEQIAWVVIAWRHFALADNQGKTIGHDYEQPVVLASMSKRRSSSLNGLCLFEHRLPSATGPKDSW